MALKLLAILIALALLGAIPRLARYRRFGWLSVILRLLGHGLPGVVLVVLLPALLAAAIAYSLNLSLAGVLWLIYAVAVLVWTLGPRELETDLESIFNAADETARLAAAQVLKADPVAADLPWQAQALVGAGVTAALQRRFALLFWFFLLGPGAAVAYRLLRQCVAQTGIEAGLEDRLRAKLGRVADALDWAPAHLMVLAMALVSNFDAVLGTWRRWHAQSGHAWFGFSAGFLPAIASVGVNADVEAGDGYAEDLCDVPGELEDLGHILNRVLVVWLTFAALLVLGGWLT